METEKQNWKLELSEFLKIYGWAILFAIIVFSFLFYFTGFWRYGIGEACVDLCLNKSLTFADLEKIKAEKDYLCSCKNVTTTTIPIAKLNKEGKVIENYGKNG